MSNLEYEEKRHFPRMKMDSIVQFKLKNNHIISSGKVVDISATGLKLLTQVALKQDDLLVLIIPNQHEKLDAFAAEARVIRISEHVEDTQRAVVSLQFIQNQ
jgi:c-di-GMP-binding flagellar brake protein YcgR